MPAPLVSVISPCFNGESYLGRFLDSILAQTHPAIELILINDGSSDGTEDVAQSYRARLARKGVRFLYVHQENGGAASAVNKGLKLFTGAYLTWPDSDDILDPDCLTAKVAFLEANPACGLVYGQCRMALEGRLPTLVGRLERRRRDPARDTLFEDLLLERDVYFAPVGHMARSTAFLKAIPGRHIHESHGGQNWQLLLPLAYHFPCGYVDREWATYVYRHNSHSRSAGTHLAKYERQEKLLAAVLESMEIPDRARYLDLVREKYRVKRLAPDPGPDRLGLFPHIVKALEEGKELA